VGAAASARASGFTRVIAFDMGSTSTDVSLVEAALPPPATPRLPDPRRSPDARHPHGRRWRSSLARFDAGGVLRVGPESAGADPGPICYGRGIQPTVTDANLLLAACSLRNFSWRVHSRPRPHPPHYWNG